MKKFSVQHGIGKAKYLVNFCTGEKFNSDGSLFWDIRIFKNKKKFNSFVKELRQAGYTN